MRLTVWQYAGHIRDYSSVIGYSTFDSNGFGRIDAVRDAIHANRIATQGE